VLRPPVVVRPHRAALALVTTACVVLAACSSGSGRAHGHTNRAESTTSTVTGSTAPARASSTTTTPHTTPPASTIDASSTATLRAHLVDTVAGYTLQPAGSTGTGPSSLAAAANDAGGGNEAAVLTSAGFRAGYKLLFSAGDRQILLLAYRFATPAGAHRYLTHAYAARVQDSGAPATGSISGVPGALVVNRSESDAATALVLFTRGATLVILSTILPARSDATAQLAPVASAQYARLAGY
jgi:hypothetical protein